MQRTVYVFFKKKNPSSPPFFEPSRTLSCVVNYCLNVFIFPVAQGVLCTKYFSCSQTCLAYQLTIFFSLGAKCVCRSHNFLLCMWNNHNPLTCPNQTERFLHLNTVYLVGGNSRCLMFKTQCFGIQRHNGLEDFGALGRMAEAMKLVGLQWISWGRTWLLCGSCELSGIIPNLGQNLWL